MNVSLLKAKIIGFGEATLSIDNDKGFSIVSEFRKRRIVDGVAMPHRNMVLISVNFRKGVRGLPGVFKRGSLLYSPLFDSLVVVLRDFDSREQNYIEVGTVEEGLEIFDKLKNIVKIRITLL